MQLPIVLIPLLVYTVAKRASNKEDDDVIDPKVDSFPTHHQKLIHVPFGHIFRDGIGDPNSDMKQPVDFLEFSLKTPETREEQEILLNNTPPERIWKIDKKNRNLIPREDFIENDKTSMKTQKNESKHKDENPGWFDFEAIHTQKMANPRVNPALYHQSKERERKKLIPNTPMSHDSGNGQVFGYGLDLYNPFKDMKWTTCKEFSKGSSSFHPGDIVDIDWTPFYIWSARKSLQPTVHRYTYPTKKIVKQYKTVYGKHINATLDWEQPKLVLNESIEMLLIADPMDRRGLFHGIPKRRLPRDHELIKLINLSVPKIRLKIVDPYLAMMFCDEYYATIMFSPGNEPLNDQERIEEASILNFTGIGYPVARDMQQEEEARKAILQQEKNNEETKYIKAYNIGGDMNLHKENVF